MICGICGGKLQGRWFDGFTSLGADGICRCRICMDAAPDVSAFVPDVMVYDGMASDVVYVPYDYSVEDLVFD